MSKRREEIRPWGLFVKTSHFQTPSSLPKLSKRVYKNVDYFLSNYVSMHPQKIDKELRLVLKYSFIL